MSDKRKNELAKKAAAGALAPAYDYGSDAGGGFEGTSSEDFTIPFLAILQAGSPQVKKKGAEYVEGAEEGMLYNTATGEVFDGDAGVQIVPCFTEHLYIEWKNRQNDTGGFIGTHALDSKVVADAKAASKKFGKYNVPVEDGVDHDLVETFVIYCLLLDVDGELIGPCMISFSSTKIKAYKGLMTPLHQVKGTPPLFAYKVKVTTVAEKNPKGDFFNFKLAPANGSPRDSLMPPDDVLVLAGKEFKVQVASGKAKVDHGKANVTSGNDDVVDPPF